MNVHECFLGTHFCTTSSIKKHFLEPAHNIVPIQHRERESGPQCTTCLMGTKIPAYRLQNVLFGFKKKTIWLKILHMTL